MTKERKIIPVAVEMQDLCADCNSACCQRGTIMQLTDDERRFFEEGGANIVDTGTKTRAQEEAMLREQLGEKLFSGLYGIVSFAPENPLYLLLEDCPYLGEDVTGRSVCTVYDDPRKPEVCDDFEPGNTFCLEMRGDRYLFE